MKRSYRCRSSKNKGERLFEQSKQIVKLCLLGLFGIQGSIGLASAQSLSQRLNPTGDPIGGYVGYSRIVTTGDYIITRNTSAAQFEAIVEGASSGEVVFVEPDVELDLSNRHIDIPEGVTLASNRGQNGSRGALLYSNTLYRDEPSYMLRATGDNVRITGLRLRGPQASTNTQGGAYLRTSAIELGSIGRSDAAAAEVDNCEIFFWTRFGVVIRDPYRNRVHHNTFYHNRQDGFGNATWISGGSGRGRLSESDYPIIEANLYEFNRHDVGSSGGGVEDAGWKVRYNQFFHEQTPHQKVDRHSGGGAHSEVNSNLFLGSNPNAEDFGGFGGNDPGTYIFSNNFSDFSSLSAACPSCNSVGAIATGNSFGGSHLNQLPQPSVQVSRRSGSAPLTAVFDGSASRDPNGHSINAFRWGLHDTTYTWTAGPLERTFTSVGTHHITMYPRNSYGVLGRPTSISVSVNNTGASLHDFLTAYYSFDSDGDDEHASNDLTTVGASYSSGRHGNALRLSSSSYARLDWGRKWDLEMHASDMSFSFWINLDRLPDSYAGILGNGGTGNGDEGYLIAVRSNGDIFTAISDHRERSICSVGGSISSNAGWQHVVVNVNRANSIEVFVDGDRKGTCSISRFEGEDLLSAYSFEIGKNFVSRPQGLLDELAIYHRVLSTEEVGWLYNSGNGRRYSELAGTSSGGGNSNTAPTASITSPNADQEFIAPTDIEIVAQVGDEDGTVVLVEFFDGSDKIGEADSSPFRFVWSDVGEGEYVLRARATDNEGATTLSPPISVTVRPADTGSASQTIELQQGWNLVSLRLVPDEIDMESIFSDVASDIELVKNAQGDVYSPGYDIYDIESWDPSEAYMIFALEATSITLTGQLLIPEDTPISLRAGWNLSPYIGDGAVPIEDALESIEDELVLVKDNEGLTYYPRYGINDIGSMQPGKGYRIHVDRDATLLYPNEILSKAGRSPTANWIGQAR